ncbi:hypothetical protein GCM10010206_58190 [Streptomyces cinerochromogenes]|nr:hypothetical protein GCM10010206_58190 [Streptomyces cinerochromogenes]
MTDSRPPKNGNTVNSDRSSQASAQKLHMRGGEGALEAAQGGALQPQKLTLRCRPGIAEQFGLTPAVVHLP